MVQTSRLLRWLYVGRLAVAAGIFGGVLFAWRSAEPRVTLLATLMLLVTIGVTLVSVWYTHFLKRRPGNGFLYAQVIFDAILVTFIVHLTGGGASEFAPLYILVIAASALLLPFKGGILLGGLASVLYFTDAVLILKTVPTPMLWVQIGLFSVMALATGYLGDRLRQAGTELGAVELELRQLRLDTRDILDALDTGLVTLDGGGTLVYMNRAAERLLGIAGADWLGRPSIDELNRRAPGLGDLIRRSAETRVPVRRFEIRATVLPIEAPPEPGPGDDRPFGSNGAGGPATAYGGPPPAAGSAASSAVAGVATTRIPTTTADDPAPATAASATAAPSKAAGHPSGDRILGLRTTILEREGESVPWVTAVFQDITDGKRAEELGRRAVRLQAVAELAASLAHEIKNPLASIRSAVEQLTGDRLTLDDRGILERLALKESDRLSRLLSEFIEFSWVKVGTRKTVDLGVVTAEAVALAAQHPERTAGGARIDFDPPARTFEVEGDEDLLHRAVFNLVLNGLQHAGIDGVVRVRLARVETGALPLGVSPRPQVRITVADTGPGIPAENVPRIFDPFFTTRSGGTGLGLALVHRAVEAHAGAIFVDTAPGRGCRFTIYLPETREPSL